MFPRMLWRCQRGRCSAQCKRRSSSCKGKCSHLQRIVCHQQCRSRKWKILRLGIYLARASIPPSASGRAAGLQREEALWKGVPAPSELCVSAGPAHPRRCSCPGNAWKYKGEPSPLQDVPRGIGPSSVLVPPVVSPWLPQSCDCSSGEHPMLGSRGDPL